MHQFVWMGQNQSFDSYDGDSQDFKCAIIVVGPKCGDDSLTELRWLPKEAKIIGTGITIEEFEKDGVLIQEANVIMNVSGTSNTLAPIIRAMPELVWLHSTTAGVEHILCPELVDNPSIILTNAKGVFSSSLAEYVIGSCLYFAKNLRRLEEQKADRIWERFAVNELRGRTMGIIGYGDVGMHCARLAKCFGMRVLALRKRPELCEEDDNVDEVFCPDDIATVMSESDYLVVAAALTDKTRGLIGRRELAVSKQGQVLINISRGAVVDEISLIDALRKKDRLAGAALDVFVCEPLPKTSPLWDLPNLLLSPHNADMTKEFRHHSIKFFTNNCHKFVAGEELDCVVDKRRGY